MQILLGALKAKRGFDPTKAMFKEYSRILRYGVKGGIPIGATQWKGILNELEESGKMTELGEAEMRTREEALFAKNQWAVKIGGQIYHIEGNEMSVNTEIYPGLVGHEYSDRYYKKLAIFNDEEGNPSNDNINKDIEDLYVLRRLLYQAMDNYYIKETSSLDSYGTFVMYEYDQLRGMLTIVEDRIKRIDTEVE